MNTLSEGDGMGYIINNTFTEWDVCGECELYRVKEVCQHCGDGVCRRKGCCQVFPHKNNRKFVICNDCATTIDDKLILVINYSDLRLLKQKIKSRLTRAIKNIEKSEKIKRIEEEEYDTSENE
jgi:superfamily II DNA helicase RecQ